MDADPLISKNAYLGTTGTFFVLAIIVATARIAIRVHKFRRLYADDYLLLLATGAFIGSNALFFVAVRQLYLYPDIAMGRAPINTNLIQAATDMAVYAAYAYAAEILSWIAIFAVKFSFLLYFRTLVQRLRTLTVWWRVVFIICIPIAIMAICGTFIVCPHVGSRIIAHCLTRASFRNRERILYYRVVSAIVTDALIISIPICLLRQTQLQVRQKLSLGILLSLNTFMIAIAMVRGISAGVYGTHDQIWTSFWVLLETSVSVIMVSTMVFKSLFVAKRGSNPRKYSPRYSNRLLWRRQKTPQLPEIETGATMTGIRTVIRENGRTFMGSFGKDSASLTDGSHYTVSS